MNIQEGECNMAKIILGIEDIELGYLSARGGKYIFYANGDEVVRARREYELDMLLFDLNDRGMTIFDTIPYPFSKFMAGTGRADLIKKAGIKESDDDFIRLYKLAGLKLMRQNFSIAQAD